MVSLTDLSFLGSGSRVLRSLRVFRALRSLRSISVLAGLQVSEIVYICTLWKSFEGALPNNVAKYTKYAKLLFIRTYIYVADNT